MARLQTEHWVFGLGVGRGFPDAASDGGDFLTRWCCVHDEERIGCILIPASPQRVGLA
ncbi:MAG: hypothetical protein O2957_02250 [Verrucomicrobia bacterium]|jgi:hypothetical protein|nr:hypothetical protein [Verrucomicrobiota bacterium]